MDSYVGEESMEGRGKTSQTLPGSQLGRAPAWFQAHGSCFSSQAAVGGNPGHKMELTSQNTVQVTDTMQCGFFSVTPFNPHSTETLDTLNPTPTDGLVLF